jgi:hypothetical protein
MRTIEQMIQSEVLVCLSSLVSTLAGGYADMPDGLAREKLGPLGEMRVLAEQAFELACPVPDYEEAAIQAGWRVAGLHGAATAFDNPDFPGGHSGSWETLCGEYDIEPYDREVFEHWAVTDWFADELIAAGEKVDKDFAGMCVWARTTTGQGIAQDYVIQCIHKSLQT